MGVERAVTRWYVQRQIILAEIAHLVEKQEQASHSEVKQAEEAVTASTLSSDAVTLQLEQAQRRLKGLGHCPRPMMG